jgi:hypothetical protein
MDRGEWIMKYLIRSFMGIGFVAMLLGLGAMDSTSVIVPVCITALGIGMLAFGGYIESYYEWYEERREKR